MNPNESNSLESRMRSWTPRRPSPALEARLFAGAPARRRPGWGWLAPVACVFVLALQLAGSGASRSLAPGGLAPAGLAGLSLSNHSLTAYAPGWAHSFQNGVSRETFESTNWTTAPSPMRTLPAFLTLTNGLIQ
jgi:hypothetical protein